MIKNCRFWIVCRRDEKSFQLKQNMTRYFESINMIADEKSPHVVFTIGGDGTFLFGVHKYIDIVDKVDFVPIHTGTLGFVAEYTFDDVYKKLHEIDFLNYQKIYRFPLLECKLDDGQVFYAVNDIRVDSLQTTQLLDVYINDSYFETFRGNGILVCTQFGSTAMNRSLNGAVIDAGVPCIEMTEIAGLSHQNYRSCKSSIIFKNTTSITLKNDNYQGISLLYDQFEYKLDQQKSVTIRECEKVVRMRSYKNVPYLTRIKYLF